MGKLFRLAGTTFAVIMAVAGWCGAEVARTVSAASEPAFVYYTLDPIVVYTDDEDTLLTIEVATTGVDVAGVRLVAPVEYDLFDDGTCGDRVAGDGIFTTDRARSSRKYGSLRFGTHEVNGRYHIVIDLDGGGQEEYWLAGGFVKPDLHIPAVRKGDGMYATSHAFFIVDPEGALLDTTDWPLGYIHCGQGQFGVFEKLYSVYPDAFDFAIVMPAHPIYDPSRDFAENVPYFIGVSNDVENIGGAVFDNTEQFHSDGRLMGMIYHSWGYGSILDHEFGHRWSAYLGTAYDLSGCDDCFGPHWNPLSDIAGQMSAFILHPDAPYGGGHLLSNGDGTWRIDRQPGNDTPYSSIDLYAMGLIPPSEVEPIHILIDPDTRDVNHVTCSTIETITIEDIMATEGGEREPSWEDSPKEFTVAMVVVKNADFTQAEYDFYTSVARYFSSTEQGELSMTTFYHATGGRASLDARLPVAPRVASGRVSP